MFLCLYFRWGVHIKHDWQDSAAQIHGIWEPLLVHNALSVPFVLSFFKFPFVFLFLFSLSRFLGVRFPGVIAFPKATKSWFCFILFLGYTGWKMSIPSLYCVESCYFCFHCHNIVWWEIFGAFGCPRDRWGHKIMLSNHVSCCKNFLLYLLFSWSISEVASI